MFEGVIDVGEFLSAYASRDIVKIVKLLERKYRKSIAPLVRENKLLKPLEAPAGQVVGQKIGQHFVDVYNNASDEQRMTWQSNRWLHHGALGELLIHRALKKKMPFIVGLGRGLCMTDLQDKAEWHTQEYYRAKMELEKMR
jgi:hypothetical protein